MTHEILFLALLSLTISPNIPALKMCGLFYVELSLGGEEYYSMVCLQNWECTTFHTIEVLALSNVSFCVCLIPELRARSQFVDSGIPDWCQEHLVCKIGQPLTRNDKLDRAERSQLGSKYTPQIIVTPAAHTPELKDSIRLYLLAPSQSNDLGMASYTCCRRL